MGFHRRYIYSENLLDLLKNNKPLNEIFNVDALIFDDNISTQIFELYQKGLTNDEILKKITYENDKR